MVRLCALISIAVVISATVWQISSMAHLNPKYIAVYVVGAIMAVAWQSAYRQFKRLLYPNQGG